MASEQQAHLRARLADLAERYEQQAAAAVEAAAAAAARSAEVAALQAQLEEQAVSKLAAWLQDSLMLMVGMLPAVLVST
jgi:hypothetical protein